MNRPRALLVGAAAAHLTLAGLFCTHVPIERELPPGLWRAATIYAGLTGVPRHYDFFAPEVSTQARAEFTLVERGGARREVRLETGSNEANQRIAMIFTFSGEPLTRRLLLDGLTDHVLARHPQARSVEARLLILDLPTPAAARAGQEARWVVFDRLEKHRADGGTH